MVGYPEPPLEELLWSIAAARLILPPTVAVQVCVCVCACLAGAGPGLGLLSVR